MDRIADLESQGAGVSPALGEIHLLQGRHLAGPIFLSQKPGFWVSGGG
jgi:hypothetical protein